jgi:hypothetical protein
MGGENIGIASRVSEQKLLPRLPHHRLPVRPSLELDQLFKKGIWADGNHQS